MKSAFYLCLLLLLGCKPEKASEELVPLATTQDPATLQSIADSVSNTRIDGTETNAGLPLDIKQKLPAILEVHLDRTHGLWQLPTLTEEDAQRIPRQEQGPYFVQADFNQDQLPDYAVQIVEKDSVYVYVFLKNSSPEEFEQHLLERHRLVQKDGKKHSNRYLALADKTGKEGTATLPQKLNLNADGLQIGTGETVTVYVWENGSFRKYDSKN